MKTLKVDITDSVDLDVVKETCRQAGLVYKRAVTYANKNRTHSAHTINGPKGLYPQIRGELPSFPSALVQSVVKNATESVKSWNSNNQKKRWHLKVGNTKYSSIRFNTRGISLRGNLITFSTVASRQRVMIDIPEWFDNRYQKRTLKSGVLKYDYRDNKVFLFLTFAVDSSTNPVVGTKVVGIDRGIKHPIYTSEQETLPDLEVKMGRVRRRYKHTRSELQSRGTRSAKRRLKAMSGREKRFVNDVNHCMSKVLANDPDVATYVLEDLTSIRKNAVKGKMGKKTRSWVNSWPFFQFQMFLEYKCNDLGKGVVYVDARYTSQRCNQCGMIEKKNRKSQSRYLCACGWETNADYNASLNIRDRYLGLWN